MKKTWIIVVCFLACLAGCSENNALTGNTALEHDEYGRAESVAETTQHPQPQKNCETADLDDIPSESPVVAESKSEYVEHDEAMQIAKKEASAVLKTVQKEHWPEAKLDTVLFEAALVNTDNSFCNTGYPYDRESLIAGFAIGNENDNSKMLIIYVDAFGKVIKSKFYEVKITPEKAEKIALTAAKSAKKTVSFWGKDANIKRRDFQFILHTPYGVYAIDQLDKNRSDSYEGHIDRDTPMYEVEFQDIDAASSFLTIYIDAATGEVIGGKYTSD